jgi:transcription elongation GreA/GreB family factor
MPNTLTPPLPRPLIDRDAARVLGNTKLAQEFREAMEAGKPEAIEAAATERLGSPPLDPAFFVPLVKAYHRRKDSELAEFYLSLVLDALRAQGDLAGELALLAAVLTFWPEHESSRGALVDLTRTAYPESRNFNRFVDHFKVRQAPDLLQALGQLEAWLAYDEGHGVYMHVRGLGRVAEVNPVLGTIRINFVADKGKLETFRIGEAQKLLTLLPPGHFLLDVLENTTRVAVQAAQEPVATLARFFASVTQTLTLAELRAMLAPVVPDAVWDVFWQACRKDARLTVGSGKHGVVRWAASGEAADGDILKQLAAAAPRDKLEFVKTHAERSSDLLAAMIAELARAAAATAASDPSLALELVLAIERHSKQLPDTAAVLLGQLIARPDPAAIVAGVRERNLRRRAVSLVREKRSDWTAVYLTLMRDESDSQTLVAMYEALAGEGEAGLLERLVADSFARPAEAPRLYLWLAQRIGERPELASRATWGFLEGLLAGLANQALKTHHAALRKLFDDDGPVPLALVTIDEKQAKQLLTMLDRAPNLEDYRRERLAADVYSRFPQLKEKPAETTFLTTAEALAAKRAEFEKLVKEDIPHNTEEMKRAKAHGDLKENFEYHAARARQEMLSSRAKTLYDHLTCARALDPAKVDASTIVVGTRVTLAPVSGGEPYALTILGPWDSDPANHVVSYTAPAAAAMLGRKVGEQVEYDGTMYAVTGIAAWR